MLESHNFQPTRTTETLRIKEHDIDIDDPFIDERFAYVNSEVDRLAKAGAGYYDSDGMGAIGRKRTSTIDMDNPATKELISLLPSVADWIATVPTAAALHPLYRPDSTHLPNGAVLDENIGDWFRNIADARGMRSRGEVMKGVLESEARDATASQKWLSLACGAAQPVFSVLEKLQNDDVALPVVTLADLDKDALAHARTYAADNELGSQIETKRLNVLRRDGLSYRREDSLAGAAKSSLLRLRGRLPAEAYDAVDAVGILEYLKRPDWKYSYKGVVTTSQKMAGAEHFLQNAYELVKPGGLLIIGNMLDTHPQLDFTLNVIQWPHIQPRSTDEMTDIFNTVGIEGDVDIYKPSDGVYALYGIRKPE